MKCKFNIGDKVVVVDAKPAGRVEYKNGDVGIVTQIDHVNHGYVTREDGAQMNVYWDEVEFCKEQLKESTMEQTAERIREDILHIEKRIEEAKKDIASMEEEKNVLIEKLKEKGFVLVETLVVVQEVTDDVIKLGDKVRIVNEDYHDYDCTQQTAVVFEIDDSNRPYRVQVKPGVDFWCKKSEIKKI